MYGRVLDLNEGIVNDLCHLAQRMPHDEELARINPVFKFLSDLRDAINAAIDVHQRRLRDFYAERAATPADARGVTEGK